MPTASTIRIGATADVRRLGTRRIMLLLAVALLLSACSSAPPVRGPASDARQEIVRIAREMVGVPYRYGGTTPRGFDCSGLVQFSYRQVGIDIPRTTREQYTHARPLQRADLREGDLVFFRLNSRRISHVGIYIGRGRFIHAPSTGKRVFISELEDGYWRDRFAGGGQYMR